MNPLSASLSFKMNTMKMVNGNPTLPFTWTGSRTCSENVILDRYKRTPYTHRQFAYKYNNCIQSEIYTILPFRGKRAPFEKRKWNTRNESNTCLYWTEIIPLLCCLTFANFVLQLQSIQFCCCARFLTTVFASNAVSYYCTIWWQRMKTWFNYFIGHSIRFSFLWKYYFVHCHWHR